jgi:hypothetical protein
VFSVTRPGTNRSLLWEEWRIFEVAVRANYFTRMATKAKKHISSALVMETAYSSECGCVYITLHITTQNTVNLKYERRLYPVSL